MNDKLKTLSVKLGDLCSGRGHGRGMGPDSALVRLSISTGGQKEDRCILRFSFHKRALEMAGWIIGDLIDAQIDGGNCMLFRGEKGRTLSDPNNRKGSTRTHVRYALPREFREIFVAGECREVEIEGGRIAFRLPGITA